MQLKLGQDSEILPFVSECFTTLCRGALAEETAGKMLEQFEGSFPKLFCISGDTTHLDGFVSQLSHKVALDLLCNAGWQEHRAPIRQAAKTLSFAAAVPPAPHLARILSTNHQISLFVEFLAHTIITAEYQPLWMQHLTAAAGLKQEDMPSSDQNHPPTQSEPHGASVVSNTSPDAQTTLDASGEAHVAQQHPTHTIEHAAHLTPWVCPPQASQAPLELPESSVIAPEAAAALESSSAAAADALHGILVQVAMARGEDTTSFVKTALKDPSVMQVYLYQ